MLDKEKNIQTPEIPYPISTPIPEEIPSKKKLIPSFIAGLQDFTAGESYRQIFGYFVPEFISALLLYSFLNICDAFWIAKLKSTSTYATFNVTSNLIHLMVKVAEGLAIGSVVLCGQHNGLTQYKTAGRVLRDVFWVNIVVGTFFAATLFFGAHYIYVLYGVPEKMIGLGTPYLRVQALRVFFMFVYLALIGFLKGIKNTKVPMNIFMMGAAIFLFFDYSLIGGNFGFPALGFQGSAISSVIQYTCMSVVTALYLMVSPQVQKYEIQLFKGLSSWDNVATIFHLSWPTIIDKSMFALSYISLLSMITSMGKYVIASFGIIKDLERLALVPAMAFAQVITFLVSNAYGIGDWQAIKSNIKKILFLSSVTVCAVLVFFCCYAHMIIPYFDPKTKFTDFSVGILPYISVLAFFDVVQLILSGALRGSSNVRVVMFVRAGTLLGIFFPLSYILSKIAFEDPITKFLAIYGSFYATNAVMSIIYIYHLRGENWKKRQPVLEN